MSVAQIVEEGPQVHNLGGDEAARRKLIDEPTSAQAQIVDLLRDLQTRHNLAYLFISHDLKVVRAMADGLIVVMRDGKVVEQGPASRIFGHPEHPYTKALPAAAVDLEVLAA